MDSNVLYEAVIFLSSLAEIYMVTDFYRAFHERKENVTGRNWTLLIVSTILLSAAIYSIRKNAFSMAVIPLVWLGILLIGFQGKTFSLFWNWALTTIIMQGSKFIFLILLCLSIKLPTNEMFEDNFFMASSMLGVRIFSFFVLFIVKQILRASGKRINLLVFTSYAWILITSLGIIMGTPYIKKDREILSVADVGLVVMYIIIFCSNLMLFYFLEHYNREKQESMLQEKKLIKYQEKQWYYDEIDQKNQRQAVFMHDMHHYLKQIGACAKGHEVEEITKIVEDLQIEFFSDNGKEICANRLLNVIFNDFKEEAAKQNVNTEIFVEEGFKIEYVIGTDMIAIFGNLLENALEAAGKCDEGKVYVKLFMQNDGLFSVIRIQNNYEGRILSDGENILTIKEKKEEHGMGLKSVRKTVQKYGGFMKTEYKNQTYTTVLILPVNTEFEKINEN